MIRAVCLMHLSVTIYQLRSLLWSRKSPLLTFTDIATLLVADGSPHRTLTALGHVIALRRKAFIFGDCLNLKVAQESPVVGFVDHASLNALDAVLAKRSIKR